MIRNFLGNALKSSRLEKNECIQSFSESINKEKDCANLQNEKMIRILIDLMQSQVE